MYIAVDFDGTCVTHAFPEMGEDIGAVPVLRRLVANGHKLILLTMRSHTTPGQSSSKLSQKGLTPIDANKDTLQEAIDWFTMNYIPLYAVNDNPSQKYWTSSRKVYANIYIDDTALGIPLISTPSGSYVDWVAVEKLLEEKHII